jgi:hypothetical protein
MKQTPAPHDLLALTEVQEVYKLSSGKRPLDTVSFFFILEYVSKLIVTKVI